MKRPLACLLPCLLVACSSAGSPATSDDGDGGDPSPTTTIAPGSSSGGTAPSGSASDAGIPQADDAAAPPASDDASPPPPPPPGDGGAGGGGATGTGVFGGDAGAYVATLGPSADNPKHAGNPNPAGTACLGCHGGQRPNVARFLFAGTAYGSAAGTAPAAQAEVRIVEANGTAHSAYTDANGNFFFRAGAETLAPPASAGLRNAQATMTMTNVFSVGDCNTCHRAGGEGPLHAP